jgi:hypothetical protein
VGCDYVGCDRESLATESDDRSESCVVDLAPFDRSVTSSVSALRPTWLQFEWEDGEMRAWCNSRRIPDIYVRVTGGYSDNTARRQERRPSWWVGMDNKIAVCQKLFPKSLGFASRMSQQMTTANPVVVVPDPGLCPLEGSAGRWRSCSTERSKARVVRRKHFIMRPIGISTLSMSYHT